MDKKQIWNFIHFIRLPLGNEQADMNRITDPDWELMYRLSVKHNMSSLGYEAARIMQKAGAKIPSELLQKWKLRNDQSTMQCLYQQAAQEEMADAFDEADVPVIFLKGAILREWYPAPELRSMSDIDVLIHEEDAEKARKIMQKLAYTSTDVESRNEDIYHRDSVVTVEIHRQLFWKKDKWNAYFRGAWDRKKLCVINERNMYMLSTEDFYLHLLGHLVHHMENGGLGVKAFVDLDIFRKKNSADLRAEKMQKLLEQFGFVRLEESLERLFSVWNGERGVDEFAEEWTEFIIMSGVYGNTDNFIIRNPALNSRSSAGGRMQKLGYVFRRLFPKYEEMCHMYPAVRKKWYMYPVYWGIRLVRNGLMRHRIIRKEVQKIRSLDREKIRKLNDLYEKIGISGEKE